MHGLYEAKNQWLWFQSIIVFAQNLKDFCIENCWFFKNSSDDFLLNKWFASLKQWLQWFFLDMNVNGMLPLSHFGASRKLMISKLCLLSLSLPAMLSWLKIVVIFWAKPQTENRNSTALHTNMNTHQGKIADLILHWFSHQSSVQLP